MGGSQTPCVSYTYSSFKMFKKSTRFALAIFNLKVFGARYLGSSVHVYTVYSTCYKSPAKRFLFLFLFLSLIKLSIAKEGGAENACSSFATHVTCLRIWVSPL